MKCPHCGSFRAKKCDEQPFHEASWDCECRACGQQWSTYFHSQSKPHIKLESGLWHAYTGPMRGGVGHTIAEAWDELQELRGF